MSAAYEHLSILCGYLFYPNEFFHFVKEIYPEYKPLESLTYIDEIHDTIRFLDRKGLIDDKFFSIAKSIKPGCIEMITNIQERWRSKLELKRSRFL